MTNFRIANFRRDLAADQAPAIPTLRMRHVAVHEMQVDGRALGALAFGETRVGVETVVRELRIN
jgi:hypothetical protein